jgi:hypothetical protein
MQPFLSSSKCEQSELEYLLPRWVCEVSISTDCSFSHRYRTLDHTADSRKPGNQFGISRRADVSPAEDKPLPERRLDGR